jgi:antitoxin (DNA-binding transcriptional repressor) of toxin-antitoxin stability system
MKASILDLRRRMRSILDALERNEPVTILYRGKEKGVILPCGHDKRRPGAVAAHPAFGMWKDREDTADVGQFVRRLRAGRTHAL